MSDPKRRYIDELLDGIRFSSGGPVSISLETAKRLADLNDAVVRAKYADDEVLEAQASLDEEMPEPMANGRDIDAEVEELPSWQQALIPTLRPDYVVPSIDGEIPEPKP